MPRILIFFKRSSTSKAIIMIHNKLTKFNLKSTYNMYKVRKFLVSKYIRYSGKNKLLIGWIGEAS